MNAAIKSFLAAELALSFFALQTFKSLSTVNEHHSVDAATVLTIIIHGSALLALIGIIVAI